MKSQQRESDSRDSLMVQRPIEIVSNQARSNSNSNNPIAESRCDRCKWIVRVLFVHDCWSVLSSKAVLDQQRERSESPQI